MLLLTEPEINVYMPISLTLLFPILVGQLSTRTQAFNDLSPPVQMSLFLLCIFTYTLPVVYIQLEHMYVYIYLDIKVVDIASIIGNGYLSFTPLPNFGWPTFNMNGSISNDLSPPAPTLPSILQCMHTCTVLSIRTHVHVVISMCLSGCMSNVVDIASNQGMAISLSLLFLPFG